MASSCPSDATVAAIAAIESDEGNIFLFFMKFCIYLYIDCLQLFYNALASVHTDPGFSGTSRARLCATRLHEWILKNKQQSTNFISSLVSNLIVCINHPRKVKCHTHRERMWEKYYQYRSSEEFIQSWTRTKYWLNCLSAILSICY